MYEVTLILAVLAGYFFITFLSNDLYKYLGKLRELFENTASSLFNLFLNILSRNKNNIQQIRTENTDSYKARMFFWQFTIIVLFLFVANIFVLTNYLAGVEGLNAKIFSGGVGSGLEQYGWILYAHAIAAVIIMLEFGWGIFRYYWIDQRKKKSEEESYAMTLWIVEIIAWIFVFVEGIIWFQLSDSIVVKTDFVFPVTEGTPLANLMRGFFAFFGMAFTYAEYMYGYTIAKSQDAIESSHFVKFIQILFFTLVSLPIFLASALIYALYVVVYSLILIIEFVLIPSRYILQKTGLMSE